MVININDSQTGSNIFRLAAALCLVLIINPGQYSKQKEPQINEHGIGGGHFSEEITAFDDENGVVLTPASLEVAIEPENVPKSRVLLSNYYTIKSGDNISNLAISFGLNQDTIISLNKITNSRLLQVGKVLKIPNQDGIIHTVKAGETLNTLSEKYKVETETLQLINELFSAKVTTGTELFIPGARLDWAALQEINGDLFLWPVNGALTSYFGWRTNPFNRSQRQFHNGIDIRGRTGTPVRAAMAGRVSAVGFDRVFGNYIIINHNSGYRTLYGHLSVIRTRTGAYVAAGERIADVGSTGQSTGPHLHFTVYKNGVTVNPRPLMR